MGTTPAPPAGAARAAPVTIPGYWIGRVIGRGGFGDVFAAHGTAGRVAVKVLRADLAGRRETIARFEREIRCIGRLDHPSTPRLLDVGQLADGRPYYVMELLDGVTLADRVAEQGALPLAEVIAIARAIAGALDRAHACGIVHRDVKPSNVFLADRPVLLDFGIAKLLDDANLPITRSQTIVGSPAAMSPEQVVGGPVDPRSDIYSLAVVAYVAASGRYPFHHAGPAMADALAFAVDPRPIARACGAPDAVDAVLRRALAHDPGARPPSAGAFVDELAQAVVGDDDAIAVFVALARAGGRSDAELDRCERLLADATRALATCGLIAEARSQDSVLLIGPAGPARDARVAAMVRELAGPELAIAVGRGPAARLRVVSSWVDAGRSL